MCNYQRPEWNFNTYLLLSESATDTSFACRATCIYILLNILYIYIIIYYIDIKHLTFLRSPIQYLGGEHYFVHVLICISYVLLLP